MKNFGQLWALVLATGEGERETSSASVSTDFAVAKREDASRSSTALLGYVLNRAARPAHRERVWAVVTQQHRRQLKGPLWFLPASSFVVLPEFSSTTFGILMGLLRIVQRDPAARLVVLPASHDVRNGKPLMRSLRYVAAHTIVRPDDLFILGVEPEAHDLDFSGIIVGRDDRRGAFEVEQAVVRGANPDAEAELNAHLLGLDFHRHVLPGNERYLSVLPVARCGWTDVGASERSAQMLPAADEQSDAPTHGALAARPPLFSWSALDQELP